MTPSPSTSSVALRFDPGWRVLPGAAFGFPGPTLLGRARVRLHAPPDRAALDHAFAVILTEPPPAWHSEGSIASMLVAHVLFWVSAVQRLCKVPVFESGRVLGETQSDGDTLLDIALPCTEPGAAQAAADWVALACSEILATQAASTAGATGWASLQSFLQRHAVAGVNMFRFLAAAHALDIPARPLVAGVYAFGTGRTTRWLESSYTDRTSVIGSRIARDKVRTAQLLRQAGLPVAAHLRVASAAQALDAARQLGYPVVVKPADRDQGLGVAADLADEAAVTSAFHAAAAHSRNILVESHFPGRDYRLNVLHGRLIKTVLRQPGGVTGDGIHTIADLVAQAVSQGAMARRTQDRGRALLALDAEALALLAGQALEPHSIPPPGSFVCLRRRANVSAGGTPTLVDGPIHPDNRRLAERAAQALQLDLAGIDLIIPDIAVSWMESGAVICEVNGQPQIGSSTSPGIYQDILRELLPGRHRMPVVLILGDPGAAVATLPVSAQARGRTLGTSSTEGVWLRPERLAGRQPNSFAAGQVLLAQRDIDAAAIAMSPAQVLLFGLPFERCDAVLLLPPDTGARWSDTEMSALWRLIGPAVTGSVLPTGAVALAGPPPAWSVPHRLHWLPQPLAGVEAVWRLLEPLCP